MNSSTQHIGPALASYLHGLSYYHSDMAYYSREAGTEHILLIFSVRQNIAAKRQGKVSPEAFTDLLSNLKNHDESSVLVHSFSSEQMSLLVFTDAKADKVLGHIYGFVSEEYSEAQRESK